MTAVGNIADRASVTWLLARAKDHAETMSLPRTAVQRAERAGAKASDFVSLYDDPAVIEYEMRSAIISALGTDGSSRRSTNCWPSRSRMSKRAYSS